MIIKSASILKDILVGLLISSLLFSFSSMSMADTSPKYDLVLSNGTIVDGTGSARFDSDIGIKDGRIVAVGDLASEASTKAVDITGQVRGYLGPAVTPIIRAKHIFSRIINAFVIVWANQHR